MEAPTASDSLVEAAIKILKCPDPWLKAAYTRDVVKWWRCGDMAHAVPQDTDKVLTAPDRPARADDKVRLVPPGQMPRLGKGGSLASRQAIVHSLCHIESWAVDLSWDIIARWGSRPDYRDHLPRQFYDDFVTVADDECRHFLALEERLKQLGSYYGALPAHDGLWESAMVTSHSLAARLSVEHCVHEARGLDVLPATIAKFRNNGDEDTAKLLEDLIYPEEVTHCAAGVRWLKHLHDIAWADQVDRLNIMGNSNEAPLDEAATPSHEQCRDHGASGPGPGTSWMQEARRFTTVQAWFHHQVRSFFHGSLKPPFNDQARAQAGFEESWYLPLVAS